MGILPLKKRLNRDKCSFATKQRMFGFFAIDEILRYRWTRFPGSRTLCQPDCCKLTTNKSLFSNGWAGRHCPLPNTYTQVINGKSNYCGPKGEQQAVFVGLLLMSGLWILPMTKSPSLFCFWICQWQDECQPAPQLDWHITAGAIVCGQEWRSGKIQWSIVTLLHRSLVNPFHKNTKQERM